MSYRLVLPILTGFVLALPALAVNGNPGGIRSNESIFRTERPGVVPTEKMTSDQLTQKRIAPHTVTIQTELQTAIDEVKGLRAQLEAIPDQKQPDPSVISHLTMHSKQLNSSLKMTATHGQHLVTAARELPALAQSEEYKSTQTAVQQAEMANRNWQQKAKDSSYWNQTNQAINDLKNLEKTFENAIDKSKSLNSRFDIRSFS